MTVSPGDSTVFFREYDLRIRGWDNGTGTVFFIPSYINLKALDQTDSPIKICGSDGQIMTEPSLNEMQDIIVRDPEGNETPWKLGFYSSENLYTIDITLDGIGIGDIDHDVYSDAVIDIHSPDGRRTYHDKDAAIKGRGNSTWESAKKPYEIRLSAPGSLCGLKTSGKWVLLANSYDDTKILNKLAFDLSDRMGMEGTTDSEWADLYINGEYCGNYLLCKEPSLKNFKEKITDLEDLNEPFFDPEAVFADEEVKGYLYRDAPADISGGYLIEKNWNQSFFEKKTGFHAGGYCFTVKEPDNASMEEIGYVRDYFEGIDDAIQKGEDLSRIDFRSFSRRFLLEEFLYNIDYGRTSCFFYKKQNDDVLYAGPCWDYDLTCGRVRESSFNDYTGSLLRQEKSDAYPEILKWDRELLENGDYRRSLYAEFRKLIPLLQDAYLKQVDAYRDRIGASLAMDALRWSREGGSSYRGYYSDPDNKYRHVKFFLNKRLEHLMELCETASVAADPGLDRDETHRLTFITDEGEEIVREVKDGSQLKEEELPEYDRAEHEEGWICEYNNEAFSYYIPVYEDMVLILR